MLVCQACFRTFEESQPLWRCTCGDLLALRLPGMFALGDLARRDRNIWRYHEALGVPSSDNRVTLGEGGTPLLAANIDGAAVSLKLDYLCPTGSYKDRGSAVGVSKLKEWGITEFVEDSSGNAGASMAAYAAAAGMKAAIFVPASASGGKLAQIGLYGADLRRIPGTREDTAAAAWEAAQSGFYASHNWSPYFLAGLKTLAYEIAEQLRWSAPDWVVTPCGNGGLLAGLHQGFRDLMQAGITKSMPRLAAAQAQRCDPIFRAWQNGLDHIPTAEKQETAAEGISCAKPVRGREIIAALRDSNGVVETVSEEAIWKWVEQMGRLGCYIEPTSATAPAAASALIGRGVIPRDANVVVVLTGNGLKASDKIAAHFGGA